MTSNRAETVRKIDDLLDGHCKSCEVKADFNKEYGSRSAHLDKHCKSNCPVGSQLVELGQELSGKVRPRKQIKLEVEEVMAKPKFTLSAEEYFAERHAGKSIARIAKEQGVSEATIYNHMNKWAEEGKGAEPDKTQLLPEKETLPPDPLPEMYKMAKQEIEQLTHELAEAKQMFDEAYQRNMASNAKIGEHLQAIQELREEVEYWRGQADNAGALAGKAAEESMTKIGRLHTEIDSLVTGNNQLQEELHRLITERDAWTEEEEILLAEIAELREAAGRVPEPASEVHLLDRSIAELTRARWILNRLAASGE
ncbi:zinc-finger domain-containing protein [Paenibacillus sp. FSL L8-0470]|uniref:zinc-finger domain-containing protein n=1 Tax=Paenibacillus sp. FSL L8-0470 TaxID=2954688 RepID=UPI0030F76A54